jgi:FkbM family methyltransferase
MIRRLIRGTLQESFNRVGYDLRRKNIKGMFAIRQSFDEAFTHLKAAGFYPDLIIDVGAADGTPPLQKAFADSRFFWIEPLREFESSLKILQQSLKGDYVIVGVGSSEGSFVLYVHKDLHGSTLFNETDGEAFDGTPRTIPVTTLDQLGRQYQWNQYKKILLKVDVQGFELEVLKGSASMLSNVEVILLEVSFFRFLQNAPDFYDVVTYMKSIGYVVYDIISGLNRPLDFALGQKDLVFVKENGFFRQSHGWAKK